MFQLFVSQSNRNPVDSTFIVEFSPLCRRETSHYENTPIKIYRQFFHPKNENFKIKIFDIFLISAQNIDYGYSLEPPHRGGSNEYPQSMF